MEILLPERQRLLEESTLEGIDDQVVPTVEEIRDCFQSADKAIRKALSN